MRSKTPNKIIYVDPQKCLGCHSCEFSCAMAHSASTSMFDVEAMKDAVSRTHVVRVDDINVPMQCRHCEDAPCTKVCPTGALRQAEGQGSVSINEQSCIGCKLCSMVCPFGVISVVARPDQQANATSNNAIATKCDLCEEWRAQNGETETACEKACPTDAIKLVDLYEYRNALTRARAAEVAKAHKSIQFSF
nr:4Fe-4S dicluster domain-containing protein [uncultured Cohaesibacter sp.]